MKMQMILTVVANALALAATAQTYPTIWHKPVLDDPTRVSVTDDGSMAAFDGANFEILSGLTFNGIKYYTEGGIALDSAAISPDGTFFLVNTGTAKVIRVSDLSVRCTLASVGNPPSELKISPDGQLIAGIELATKKIHVWRTDTGAAVNSSTFPEQPTQLAWTRDSKSVLVTKNSPIVQRFDVVLGAVTQSYTFPGESIRLIGGSRNSDLFVAGDGSSVWTGDVVAGTTQYLREYSHASTAISSDGAHIVASGSSMMKMNSATGALEWPLSVAASKAAIFSYDGQQIYAIKDLWYGVAVDAADGKVVGATQSPAFNGGHISISRNGFASSASKSTYRSSDGSFIGYGTQGVINQDGTRLMGSFINGWLVDPKTNSTVWQSPYFLDHIRSAFTFDGSRVVVTPGIETRPRAMTVFLTLNGLAPISLPIASGSTPVFAPTDQFLAVGSSNDVNLFLTSSWKKKWTRNRNGVGNALFSEDGKRLFLANDGRVQVLRTDEGSEIKTITGVPNGTYRIVLGADDEVVGFNTNKVIKFVRYSDGAFLREISLPTRGNSGNLFSTQQDDQRRFILAFDETVLSLIANPYYMGGNTPPNTLTMEDGTVESGDVSKLASLDSQVAVFGKAGASQITAIVKGTAPLGQTIVMRMVGKSDSDKVVAKVELFDFNTGQYTEAKTVALGPSAFSRTTLVPVNAPNFRDALTGEVRARLTFEGVDPLIPDWKVSIDQAAWQVSP